MKYFVTNSCSGNNDCGSWNRILTLEEFGLAGFCFLFVEFTNTLVNAGVNQNLVQRKEWTDRYAASTMTFVAFMGLMASGMLVGIGAPIAYYNYS